MERANPSIPGNKTEEIQFVVESWVFKSLTIDLSIINFFSLTLLEEPLQLSINVSLIFV
ncbi:MAG: hypothetical protein K8S13_20425 [Desulfobacula sp.]|uniref:hypothetical protein n=1 Tax=Desulfobacula sp. TaxID=2593537 RepID=UPI0025C707E0|nr:hypothetical protein [Desulfobacula sp.]MCD4722203.1 hypothetical protein [Desulfobacula sp.]